MGLRAFVIVVMVVLCALGVAYMTVGDGGFPFGEGDPTPIPSATEPVVAAARRVLAEARVVPLRHVALAVPRGGRVEHVLVEEGDVVRKGDILLRLDSARQAAAVVQAEANVAAAQAELARLEAGATGQEIVAASASLEAARANHWSADAAVSAAGANLERIRSGATAEEIAIAERRVKEAENLLWGAQGQRDSVCGQVGSYGVTQADCDTAEAAVGQAYEAMQIAALDLQRIRSGASPEDQRVGRAGLTQAEGERRAAEARVAESEAVLAQLLAGATSEELAVARARVDQAKAALELARVEMHDALVRAPFSATIAELAVAEGELAGAGLPIVTLADLTEFRIETEDLTELSVVEIAEGDPATVTIDAIPDLELAGRVDFVNPIGRDRLGDIVYKVVVEPLQQDPRLRWNMTAVVDIAHE